MLLKPQAAPPSHRAVRLAWWVAFLLTIALLAAISLARSARADGIPAATGPGLPVVAPPPEGEEECEAGEPSCAEESGAEECGESGEEECEEGFAEAEGEAPAECLLTTARPRVAVLADQRQLRLEVHYTVAAAADVIVSLRSSGGKGSVALGAHRRHLARSGAFHETAALSAAETERALAAREFTLRLRVLDVPWSCHRYDFRHLAVKRQGHGGSVFSETAADLRAGH
jgi:hypothetical protein